MKLHMRVIALLCVAAMASSCTNSPGGEPPATRPNQAPESVRTEVRSMMAGAIVGCHQQVDAAMRRVADGRPDNEIEQHWRNSALPQLGNEWAGGKAFAYCGDLEDLALRLNKDSSHQVTPEFRAYAMAAAELLNDPDPAYRGMACVFLGLLGTHTLELGLLPEVAAKLADKAVAVEAKTWPSMPQTGYGNGPSKIERTNLTVGELAEMAVSGVTQRRFWRPEEFTNWWKANADYESLPWYWANRWGKYGGMNDDLAEMLDRNPRTAFTILMLAEGNSGLDMEDISFGDNPNIVPNSTIGQFIPMKPADVAALVAKYNLRDQLLAMSVGDFAWRQKIPDRAMESLVTDQMTPILQAASTRADAPELRGFLKQGRGILGKSGPAQIAFTRLVAKLDPDEAPAVLLEQLQRNPTLPSLAADLVRRTGVQHWDVIKESYIHASPENFRGRLALIEALAALEPADARGPIAELLAADPLDSTLKDYRGGSTYSENEQDVFLAFVKAAQKINGGKAVLDAEVVDRACVHSADKVAANSPEQLKADAANRLVFENREKAVAELLRFLRS